MRPANQQEIPIQVLLWNQTNEEEKTGLKRPGHGRQATVDQALDVRQVLHTQVR
jgi:hypothetical protein